MQEQIIEKIKFCVYMVVEYYDIEVISVVEVCEIVKQIRLGVIIFKIKVWRDNDED